MTSSSIYSDNRVKKSVICADPATNFVFVLSFFTRDVLDEILNLIVSVSEGFPSYSLISYSPPSKHTSH